MTAEDGIAARCQTGKRLSSAEIQRLRLPPLPLIPTGREGTTWEKWTKMTYGDIEGPARRSNRFEHSNRFDAVICNFRNSVQVFAGFAAAENNRCVVVELLHLKSEHMPNLDSFQTSNILTSLSILAILVMHMRAAYDCLHIHR